jgi:uncharacterized membrane protein
MNVDVLLLVVTLLAALGCGLVAGVFFAFSTFVMRALGTLPPPQGIAAMQSINVVVLNPWFLGLFLGTGATCLLLGGTAALGWSRPGSGLVLAGAALYLIGTLGVTMVCNVPRNEALAAVSPESIDGARLWTRYLSDWTNWNHVRTAAAALAAAAFALALR